MLPSLLADRFWLTLRHDTEEMPVFAFQPFIFPSWASMIFHWRNELQRGRRSIRSIQIPIPAYYSLTSAKMGRA